MNRGFTLIELIIVVAITGIIATVVLFGINNWKNKTFLDTEVEGVIALIEEAQNLTLSSFEDDNYGIHFASTTVTRFKGGTYNEVDPNNEVLELEGRIIVSGLDLVSGGNEFVFERLTGEVLNYGTTTISVEGNNEFTRQIVITKTGIINVE